MKIDLVTPDYCYLPLLCPIKQDLKIVYMPTYVYSHAVDFGIYSIQHLGNPPTLDLLKEHLSSIDTSRSPKEYRGRDLSKYVMCEEEFKTKVGWGRYEFINSSTIDFLFSLN